MKLLRTLPVLALCLAVLPGVAQAACFVEYKAKQDGPLRLHYGILQLDGPCADRAAATDAVRARLDAAGWILLDVVSLSGTEPGEDVRADAGEFYLRY